MNRELRIQRRKVAKLQLNLQEFRELLYRIQCSSDLSEGILAAINTFNARWTDVEVIHQPEMISG